MKGMVRLVRVFNSFSKEFSFWFCMNPLFSTRQLCLFLVCCFVQSSCPTLTLSMSLSYCNSCYGRIQRRGIRIGIICGGLFRFWFGGYLIWFWFGGAKIWFDRFDWGDSADMDCRINGAWWIGIQQCCFNQRMGIIPWPRLSGMVTESHLLRERSSSFSTW